jgi:hypothetical protein
MAEVLRRGPRTGSEFDLERIAELRNGPPSAEYVARVMRAQGMPAVGPEVVQELGEDMEAARTAPLHPTGHLDEYELAQRADGGAVVDLLERAPAMRQQVMDRSGTGAPGMVYAEQDGGAVLMPLTSAEQQGLRVISAEEAQELGQALEAAEEVVPQSPRSAQSTPRASGPAKPRVDSRMLAQALRSGR